MKSYMFNLAVIVAPGDYRYRAVGPDEAFAFLRKDHEFVAEPVAMQPGDEALVWLGAHSEKVAPDFNPDANQEEVRKAVERGAYQVGLLIRLT